LETTVLQHYCFNIRAGPMYRHVDIYTSRYDDVANISYRQYLLINAAPRRYVIVLHGMFGKPSCHFVSDWLIQILC